MPEAITVTMDGAGRFVLPKEVRMSLGLEAGQRLRIAVHDDRVELTPLPIDADLVERAGGVLVIVPNEEVAELTVAEVTDAIDRART
jgi:AbrB family looped-hinge helix DNA binding protein